MNKIIKNTRETLRIPTKITNENIKKYVKYYIESKENLPWDLKDKQIGQWDVSRVTDMNRLFGNQANFNEALNDWNVSNVTNMNGMFSNCYNFNSPLNKWDVSRVTDMGSMFMNCFKFNQPFFNEELNRNWNVSNVTNMNSMFMNCWDFNQALDSWNVSNVLDMNDMFKYCADFNQPLNSWTINPEAVTFEMFTSRSMLETNKPTMPRRQPTPTAPKPVVDPNQVHKAAGNIKYNELNDFLSAKIGNPAMPSNLNYPNYITDTIKSLISTSLISNPFSREAPSKKEQLDGVQIILNRLNNPYFRYNDLNESVRKSIFYSLEYVKKQSRLFQKAYVDSFIKDCLQAHEVGDTMSCINGVLERLVLSLIPACVTSQNKQDCSTIIPLITGFQDYILDWFKLHSPKHFTYVNEPFPSDSQARRANLKQYLLEKIKIPGKEDVVEDMIEENIKKWGDYNDYDDEDFTHGETNKTGGRRTLKRRKGKRRQTMKKAKTVKTVKRSIGKRNARYLRKRKTRK
jgi:surface protein